MKSFQLHGNETACKYEQMVNTLVQREATYLEQSTVEEAW